jgi:hypothetical protein
METLCCTAKYRKLFHLPDNLPASSSGASALGPWYANVLNVGSARLFHFMSSTALLSVFIWQRERKTAEQRFVSALADLLAELGVPAEHVEAEVAQFSSISYARATNQSVLGSLRDQAHAVPFHLGDTLSPFDVSLRLTVTPCGPMNYEAPLKVAPRLLHERWAGPRRID